MCGRQGKQDVFSAAGGALYGGAGDCFLQLPLALFVSQEGIQAGAVTVGWRGGGGGGGFAASGGSGWRDGRGVEIQGGDCRRLNAPGGTS